MTQHPILLVPVDFSPGSRRVADFAVEVAKARDAELVLMTVIDLPAYAASIGIDFSGRASAAINGLMEHIHTRAKKELTTLLEELSAKGIAVTRRIHEGVPAHAITSVAEELPADMIVMGTHGRTGLDRLIVGSVAERVVRTAPCPVLTVPIADDE